MSEHSKRIEEDRTLPKRKKQKNSANRKSTQSTSNPGPSCALSSDSAGTGPSDQTFRAKKDVYRVPAPIIVPRTPPGALDFEFFVDLIYKTDQSITRPPAHSTIFKSMENARAFVFSMAMYAKRVKRLRVDDLFDPSQPIKGYTFNWMISLSPFYLPTIRQFARVRQIEGKKLMRMISAPVDDDKYRLASSVMYFLSLLYSAKGEEALSKRFQDGSRAFVEANSFYQNVQFFVMPFDHEEMSRMGITKDDFPKALVAKVSPNEGGGQMNEKDEMLEQVDRLVSSYNKSRANSEKFETKVQACEVKVRDLDAQHKAMQQKLQKLYTKQQLAKGMETYLATVIAGGITTKGDFVQEAAKRNMSFEELGKLKYMESKIDVSQFNTAIEDMVAGRESTGLHVPAIFHPTFENYIAPASQIVQDLQLSPSEGEDDPSDAANNQEDDRRTSAVNGIPEKQYEATAASHTVSQPQEDVAISPDQNSLLEEICNFSKHAVMSNQETNNQEPSSASAAAQPTQHQTNVIRQFNMVIDNPYNPHQDLDYGIDDLM
ncbi:unnamed protein product [Orchesella dallaii]|uniref:Uncharacterized protein n=1 Tax=Orchesella dallaii TaxID=48710 RepID=A0ABP1RYQ2_9HEXA